MGTYLEESTGGIKSGAMMAFLLLSTLTTTNKPKIRAKISTTHDHLQHTKSRGAALSKMATVPGTDPVWVQRIPGLGSFIKGVITTPLHPEANFWTLARYAVCKNHEAAEETGYVTDRRYAHASFAANWTVTNYVVPSGELVRVINAAKETGNKPEYLHCVFVRTDPKDKNKGLSANGKSVDLSYYGQH
jgi:hypothetical protein